MNPYNIIRNKAEGPGNTSAEIRYLIDSYTANQLPDYQMAAWLMAVYHKGLSAEELQSLVATMLDSGESLDFSQLDGFVADKHSTGGVGDKVSLILAPILASCGIFVPMISGRALGHTGGTLDKLETIPGFNTDIDLATFRRLVESVGCGLIGQTGEICPADKKLYALRDVTATVSSIPLISASIMSKKLAEGLDGLLLDVKFGSGAFMSNLDSASELAETMVGIGERAGLKIRARLTDMNQPLGLKCGLWCEVAESVAVLEGSGPDDLRELSLILAGDILELTGESNGPDIARQALDSGTARAKFDEIVHAQGGDINALNDPQQHQPNVTLPIIADQSGWLAEVDTYALGMSLITAGGGRTKLTDPVDPTVGFELGVKVGDRVKQGDELGRYFGGDEYRVAQSHDQLVAALHWSHEQTEPLPLVVDTVG
ncbi:thymidine phosphorylase [Candidatus Neomarinimicrobiota bacterium]